MDRRTVCALGQEVQAGGGDGGRGNQRDKGEERIQIKKTTVTNEGAGDAHS